MNSANQTFVEMICNLLNEAYEGSSPTWFSDRDTGLLPTLKSVSAQTASSIINDGTSIAAHTEHLRWALEKINAKMRGAPPNMNWSESWTVQSVSKSEWATLLEQLQLEYETLISNMPANPDLNDNMCVTSGIALVAHAAYHLGAIRQMLTTRAAS